MRKRRVKPEFYTNEQLASCSFAARFLFLGLGMLTDREDRLEDRPKRIKGELLPYDDLDVGALLDELSSHGFIVRHEAGGKRFIQIAAFSGHQARRRDEIV
jgi:hypothetical protein